MLYTPMEPLQLPSRLCITFDSSETEIASMTFLLGASAQSLGGAVLVPVDF